VDCIILLTADKANVEILFANKLEIRHEDILPDVTMDVSTVIVVRLAAVVTLGNACVFRTAQIVEVFGVSVTNPYGCVI
jgi:hypothetical protein